MKLCFSSLGCSEKSLSDILSTAKSYNLSAIEIRGVNGVLENHRIEDFSAENISDTKQLFLQNNITPLVLGTSCSFHKEDGYQHALEEGIRSIRIAEALGFSAIRVFGDKILSDGQICINRVIAGLTYLCNQTQQIDILLEVHGDFNTIETLFPIVQKMKNTKNFGLIWDIEHTHKPYGDDWMTFYQFVRPYIKHVHIKDYSNSQKQLTLVGNGDVPILPIVKQLLSDGYDGYFSLEWERKWHPELPDIDIALNAFTALLESAKQ